MTLRFRNRLNLILLIISVVIFCTNISILFYSISNGTFMKNDYLGLSNYRNIIIKYIPLCPIISLLFQDFFVTIFTIVLYRSFVKTQATDIIYFSLFLISFLVDSLRIWIPLLNLQNTYSQLYIFCGNASLFARILSPSALFFTVLMGFTEQHQDVEKNISILLLISIFLAEFLPLNTANTASNFAVDCSFEKILIIYSIITSIVTVILQYFNNKSKLFSQKTTIGISLLIIGTYFLFYSLNIINLFLGISLTLSGAIIFIKSLHNQYLWLD